MLLLLVARPPPDLHGQTHVTNGNAKGCKAQGGFTCQVEARFCRHHDTSLLGLRDVRAGFVTSQVRFRSAGNLAARYWNKPRE